MGYLIAFLLIGSVLFAVFFLSRNFTLSWKDNEVFPSVYRLSEIKTKAVQTPEIIQKIELAYNTLNWTYCGDDFILGVTGCAIYPIYAYAAKLDETTSVRVEFCKGGRANVKRIVGGNKVSEEPLGMRYADTYVFKLIRNGAIVQSWAYKELDAETSKKYLVVEEGYLPVIKSLYHRVRELYPQTAERVVD